MKKIFALLLMSLFILNLSSCAKTSKIKSEENKTTMKNNYPIATIYLSNNKTIKVELYNDVAPITVENFINLAESGYYNGTVFHRIIANFMIQTGGYFLDGNQLYTKDCATIKGEFSSNGVENDIKHVPGVISMARATDKNSASSQFFICVADCAHLDGGYAAFGKTVDEESLKNAIEVSKYDTYNIGYGLTDFPQEIITVVKIEISK